MTENRTFRLKIKFQYPGSKSFNNKHLDKEQPQAETSKFHLGALKDNQLEFP